MALKLEASELPTEVLRALERGEAVEFEDEGRLVGTLRPDQASGGTALWDALARLEPLDDEFEADIERGLSLVKPQPHAWE